MKIKKRYLQTIIDVFPDIIVERSPESHKGTFGNAVIFGGAAGMGGAIALSTVAAQLMGCGKTYGVFAQDNLPVPFLHNYPEIMLRGLAQIDTLPTASAVAVGCGLGTDNRARNVFLHALKLAAGCPIVVDADALNLMAFNDFAVVSLENYEGEKVLTPHIGEAARLLKCETAYVQQHQRECATKLAETFKAWVVLKSNKTVIASHSGNLYINETGNAGLATAGSGDVLTGMITGFLAQRIKTEVALSAAVWLHGAAAECLGEKMPLAGLLAGEIAPVARTLRHQAMLYAEREVKDVPLIEKAQKLALLSDPDNFNKTETNNETSVTKEKPEEKEPSNSFETMEIAPNS